MAKEFSEMDYLDTELDLTQLYGEEYLMASIARRDKIPEIIRNTLAKFESLDKRVARLEKKNEDAYIVINDRMDASVDLLDYLKQHLINEKEANQKDFVVAVSYAGMLAGRYEAINRVLLENHIV